MTTKARLLTAYVWDCDSCGAENFERSQVAEFVDDEDRAEVFRKLNGLDEWAELPEGWREFQLVTRPDTVTCGECGMKFDATEDRDNDDSEWD